MLKYLTENAFLKKITQLHLVGIVLDEQGLSEDDHYLGDFLFDIEKIPTITKQVQKVFIYHSKDDETCPYTHAERLAKLLPNAEFLTFEERGHFMQAEFPELLENILK
ncbi:MAG: hypothetical protein LBU27_06830 [Candidatus Peribacteria bacterium]|nr:hypothetical protein [Candidatus Peribacteria bacterium]